jgi:hypothetical protein
MKKLAWIATLLTALGCGSGDGGEETGTDMIAIEATFPSIHTNVIKRRCTSGACHDASSPAGGLNLVTLESAYAGMVGRAAEIAPEKTIIVPGDPGASFLIAKLRGELAEDEGDPMPLGTAMLSEATIAKIEAWIAGGAARD